MRQPTLNLVSAGLVLMMSVDWAAAQPTFQGLGDLPGGTFYSEANGVSPNGLAVVGTSIGAGGSTGDAFLWTQATGIQPVSIVARARSVSDDGNVTGFKYTGGSSIQAFLWSASHGFLSLGSLGGPSGQSDGEAISGDGTVIVGGSQSGSPPSGDQAFRWDAVSGMVGLGDLPGGQFSSHAFGTSYDGSVIVGYGSTLFKGQNATRAFRWTQASGMVQLGDLPGYTYSSHARGVSADGNVAVGYGESLVLSPGVWNACRWVVGDTHAVPIGHLPGGGTRSVALAASADGSTIVGYSDSSCGPYTAFVWTAALGLQDLRAILEANGATGLSGWRLRIATSVSADGTRIVGWGTDPLEREQAWLAVLTPSLVRPEDCIANCDGSLCAPLLTANDFQCFLNAFAAGASRANCDGSTGQPALTSNDFQCFLNAFAAGCGR